MTIRPSSPHLSSIVKHCLRSGLLSLLFGLTVLLAFPAIASAQALHSEYVSSDPATNAVLAKAPSTITIHFSENVDPNGSTIYVYDVNHQLLSQAGSVQVDRADLKTMTVNLHPDTSEVYVVEWYTVSAVEGHHDAGSFRFFVNPSPMLASMIYGGSSMPGMSGTTTPQTSTSSSSSDIPMWSAALIGLVGLIIGGLIGVFGIQRSVKR